MTATKSPSPPVESPTEINQDPLADNGFGVVRRCAGHSCTDRNRCAAHVRPVGEDQAVIWEPWHRDRVFNRCEHFVPDLEGVA